ncbi:hypothetical protein DFH08DRAFT_1083820 [Mycena albidolilacea]|uniref:Uncharacterized protein n=1 Tax=Mycena albidolilacea TaxID=1033008 RepID=A0AAD6ZQ05_9AGAR|nr:hypothetical protein DFH08DRAFT_1083820 [Mycena albidolilacea]
MPPAVRGNVAATIVRKASTTLRPPIWPLSKNAHGLQGIKRITAGVIVNCAMMLHSPDTQPQATGDTTHINYSARLSNSSRAYAPRQIGLKGCSSIGTTCSSPTATTSITRSRQEIGLLSVRIAMRRVRSFAMRGDLPTRPDRLLVARAIRPAL